MTKPSGFTSHLLLGSMEEAAHPLLGSRATVMFSLVLVLRVFWGFGIIMYSRMQCVCVSVSACVCLSVCLIMARSTGDGTQGLSNTRQVLSR